MSTALDRFILPRHSESVATVATVATVGARKGELCTDQSALSEEDQAWAIRYLDAIGESDQAMRAEYLNHLATDPRLIEQMQDQCIALGIARLEVSP